MKVLKYLWRSGFFMVIVLIVLSCIGQSNGKKEISAKGSGIALSFVSSFSNGDPESTSAEIVAYDSASQRLFVVNSVGNKLDILDFSSIDKIKRIHSIDLKEYGKGINSVAVANGLVAVAMENYQFDKNGYVLFIDVNGKLLKKTEVGVKPDMITFSPDHKLLLVANEGEPNDTYTVDPEGSVTVIDAIPGEVGRNPYHIYFSSYNDSIESLRKKGVRIFGPNASVAQDLEPEYITISPDSRFAWVSLQENNAIAKIDLSLKELVGIYSLGEKEMNLQIGNIRSEETCPVKGYFQPDGITSFTAGNKTYVITANEGDIRSYDGYKESDKLGKKGKKLDADKFPEGEKLKDKEVLGKLLIPEKAGDTDNDGDLDEIYCYGGRSFSIWDENLNLIYDSGDDFERIACREKGYCEFNEKYKKMLEEDKWDIRGPEPESVVTGKIGDSTYVFITLERFGGVMTYNVTDPSRAKFVQYINSETQLSKGKSKPEGIIFISAEKSPNKKNLVVVANEGTSTIDVYQVNDF